jgi:hypothetical protein
MRAVHRNVSRLFPGMALVGRPDAGGQAPAEVVGVYIRVSGLGQRVPGRWSSLVHRRQIVRLAARSGITRRSLATPRGRTSCTCVANVMVCHREFD